MIHLWEQMRGLGVKQKRGRKEGWRDRGPVEHERTHNKERVRQLGKREGEKQGMEDGKRRMG